jgi:hypothetical protein
VILYELGAGDDPATATQFYGLGINANTLRYQSPLGQTHKFYCGTTLSLFITSSGLTTGSSLWTPGSLFVSSSTTLRSNLSVLGNMAITGQTHIINSTVDGGDVSLTLRNYASGLSSLYLYSNNTIGSRIFQDPGGNLNMSVNISGTSSLPVSIYSNGVINASNNNTINNKVLVLYEGGASDAPSTATNFSGIGIQTGGAMRYQVGSATNYHRFFCGTTQSFFITNGSGASGSDARWKTDVQDITDGLNKVKQLQGKTFIYNNCEGRQMGLIAQDVQPIVPEVVLESDGYYLLCYDRLVALLIESVKELESRVAALENI